MGQCHAADARRCDGDICRLSSDADGEGEVEVVEYLENMYDHTHKLPGRETVSDVTFERGMYADDYLQGIYEKVFNNNTVRNTVVIQVCDRFGKIRREFKCAEAWFSKYECADLDATSSDVIIETLTMTFEYFL